uniref:Integrase zinc-binding domain-containing protein n=1 Tax=Fagus sylvatica TaxID=28930 RepID=A0A2N9GA89_FAGSY
MPSKDNVSWMSPIVRYLKEGRLPTDKTEARKLRIRASHFQLLDGILYKMGFSRPHLRCLSPEEANYVIREVHEGICGNHSGARALAHKLTRAGYYWPSLLHDAAQYVKTCDKCQRFANIPRAPPEEITPMTSPWPFSQWGLDIMGPFPVGTKQAKFLVVAIDYFTKWVEAEPLATITEKNVKNFVWKGVICRFGIPRVLIKTRLEGAKGLWVEELPSILWAYRTTVRVPTGETPFKLTFGTEAVIPVEIGLTTLRTTFHKEEENEGQLRLNLDLLDETRDKAARRITLYQEKMAKYYNTKVKLRRFEIGDWKGDLPPRRPSWKKASLIPGMLNTSKSTIPEHIYFRHPRGESEGNRCPSEDSQTPTGAKSRRESETDAPRRTVRHPRGAKSRRESSKQMPLGGQLDTEVQSEGSCKETEGMPLGSKHSPSEDSRHPRGAKSRRESSKQMPLGGQLDTHVVQYRVVQKTPSFQFSQLDTHVVHVMKEGRPEDALLPVFYS